MRDLLVALAGAVVVGCVVVGALGVATSRSPRVHAEVLAARAPVAARDGDEVEAAGVGAALELPVTHVGQGWSRAPGFEPGFVPRAAGGMRCPDGTFLPPLNGVTVDDAIPPIQRERFMPPIGPIVGRYVDDGGDAWWITADGSAFTTRWVTVRGEGGRVVRMVRLDQSDALAGGDAALARPLPVVGARDR